LKNKGSSLLPHAHLEFHHVPPVLTTSLRKEGRCERCTQGIPTGRRSHAQADVLVAVMLMTGIQEGLCLQKVRAKEAAEGKSQRKECQALFSFSSSRCCGFVFCRSVIHALRLRGDY